MKKITWNPEKSKLILENPNRGVSIEYLAELIQAGDFLDIIRRPKYPDQAAFIVPIDEDVWCVPFRETEEEIHLITAWPDRKLKKEYYG